MKVMGKSKGERNAIVKHNTSMSRGMWVSLWITWNRFFPGSDP